MAKYLELAKNIFPDVTQFREKPKTFSMVFKDQLVAYGLRRFPFDHRPIVGQSPIEFWMQFQGDPRANLLAECAIKLFSVVPHSMADERTASTVTWLNSPKRARQSVPTIMSMVQICQFYMSPPKWSDLMELTQTRPNAHASPVLYFSDVLKDLDNSAASKVESTPNSEADTCGRGRARCPEKPVVAADKKVAKEEKEEGSFEIESWL
ncbi:hypothetical protein BXZ70DRAFT_910950 [Cristinia sonorae]|uniref:HAT C-terminal dimerisation domain-containing protein n=1 Tax=Cristinia sonorae TaxID=1940300 RepID=A0A8K0UE88_9AGAR|nr:hypothetical protein BXZ70DRAFT_910950 [Cristinia sonorae]